MSGLPQGLGQARQPPASGLMRLPPEYAEPPPPSAARNRLPERFQVA